MGMCSLYVQPELMGDAASRAGAKRFRDLSRENSDGKGKGDAADKCVVAAAAAFVASLIMVAESENSLCCVVMGRERVTQQTSASWRWRRRHS